MAVTTTFDQVAVVELSTALDKIWDISPTETPFGSSIGTTKATQVLHEWIEDSLADPAAGAAGVIQGSDATYVADNVGTRVQNRCQIFRGTVGVSMTDQAVQNYGMKQMASFLLAKRSKELKRSVEYAFLNAATVNAGTTSAPTIMGAAQSYISAATTDDNSSTPAPLTEDMILGVNESCFTLGGNPNLLICSPDKANVIAGFATTTSPGSGVSRVLNDGQKTLTAVVDIIQTPFGTLGISLDRFVLKTDLFLFDTSYWSKAILRPSAVTPLAKTGSAVKMMIETELSLQGSAAESSGLVSFLQDG